MNAPTIKLVEATHVTGVLDVEADERGTLVVSAILTTGETFPLSLNLN